MKDKISKKEKIVSVGEQLFLKNGFSNTSIEVITKNSKISKGNFYTYFKSKEELLEEIVQRTLSIIFTELGKDSQKEGSMVKIIENYVNLNISLANKYSPAIIISLREAGLFKKGSKEKFLSEKIFSEIKNTIASFLKETTNEPTEEEISFLWGITLSIWIEVFFENINISPKKMAKLIVSGLEGTKK